MKPIWKFLTVIAIVLLAFNVEIVTGYFAETSIQNSRIVKQNKLLEQKIAETKAQNDLLREEKMCLAKPTPYPQPNPADPICGDPSALSPMPMPMQKK